MDYADRQKALIKTEFAARRRNQILVSIPLIAMIVLLVVSGENPDQAVLGMPVTVWGPVFTVFLVGGIGFSLYNWRCPACKKYLGKSINPRFCSTCGATLAE